VTRVQLERGQARQHRFANAIVIGLDLHDAAGNRAARQMADA
jgi:hypothetical protein